MISLQLFVLLILVFTFNYATFILYIKEDVNYFFIPEKFLKNFSFRFPKNKKTMKV